MAFWSSFWHTFAQQRPAGPRTSGRTPFAPPPCGNSTGRAATPWGPRRIFHGFSRKTWWKPWWKSTRFPTNFKENMGENHGKPREVLKGHLWFRVTQLIQTWKRDVCQGESKKPGQFSHLYMGDYGRTIWISQNWGLLHPEIFISC